MDRRAYLESLPKKHSGSGVILLNEEREILLVKPTYKEVWILPGGVVENNESPRQAAIRETKEELGFEVSSVRLLCLDWKSKDFFDSYQFIFYGGVLNEEQINQIRLQTEELAEFRFFQANEAIKLLSDAMANRLVKCMEIIDLDKIIYLEDQLAVK